MKKIRKSRWHKLSKQFLSADDPRIVEQDERVLFEKAQYKAWVHSRWEKMAREIKEKEANLSQ